MIPVPADVPLIFQNVKANSAICVDVRVVNLRRELNLRRFEWVVCRKLDIQEENATLVRAIRWPHNRRLPREQVLAHGACTAVRGRILRKIL